MRKARMRGHHLLLDHDEQQKRRALEEDASMALSKHGHFLRSSVKKKVPPRAVYYKVTPRINGFLLKNTQSKHFEDSSECGVFAF